MAIRIRRNEAGNCITFEGSSNPVYWNACLSGEVDSENTNTVNVINDIITAQSGVTQYEFFRIPYTDFEDKDGNSFATPQEAADYITANANVIGLSGDGIDLAGETVCFSLDATSTSILLDNGYHFGVNTIKALDVGGDISIVSIDASESITHFYGLEVGNACINGQVISGGLNDVINTLNELFTVGAFEAVVISDPFSTMVADVNGVDIVSPTYVGANSIDPVGVDVFGSSASGSLNGYLSTETIDQAGEYFTFDIRVEGTIGFGLVHSQASYDAGYYSGNATYANPANFGTVNSQHSGFQFSHWFHPTPNGSWTNYGANTSYSMKSGWSNFNGTDEQADWLAGNPIKVRVGLDANGFISIETLRNGTDWVVHVRTSYPSVEGVEYRLGIKMGDTNVRLHTLPKVHLLEPAAPTMYFRYIESPDGNYDYPIFATEEEANYYDLQNGGTGSGTSSTATYPDDPTNTTWYIPTNGFSDDQSAAPTGGTFESNPIQWTEITSLTNADLTPDAFSATDITQEEGTNVNIQVSPQGATWSTSVSITPSNSGLVFDGYSLVQGTLTDVGADTVYTITVTRANAYGSSTGSMTVTATDVPPVQTNLTPWSKALDFSGSAERAQQVSSDSNRIPMKMGGTNNQVLAPTAGNTVASGHPWATVIVFNAEVYNSNQHIWNLGEGAGTTDDNIYLRRSTDRKLYFGWGRSGDVAECEIIDISSNMSTWHAIYIAHNGTRYGSNNTTSLMADAFDIRHARASASWALSSNLSTASNWTITGDGRMNRQYQGDMTIGGRGANRNFHGKVASFVSTTLRVGVAMPTTTEIELMITDPIKWLNDYKVGVDFRLPWQTSNAAFNFALNDGSSSYSCQVWLMGDGSNDSYSNMIRNRVQPADQNYTKLNMISMVSNDIENVTITGLS